MMEALILLLRIVAVLGGFGVLLWFVAQYVTPPAPFGWVKTVVQVVLIVLALYLFVTWGLGVEVPG